MVLSPLWQDIIGDVRIYITQMTAVGFLIQPIDRLNFAVTCRTALSLPEFLMTVLPGHPAGHPLPFI